MRLGCLLLAAAACRTPPPTGPSPSTKPAAPTTLDPDGIDRWVAAELHDRGVVGAAIVVVHEGAVVLARGYGTREVNTRQAIDADTPFAVGSVSKEFTCAAAMLLVDDKKLDMSDRVAKYYPDLTRAADITLDDLGAHMSGYRDYYPLDFMDARFTRPIQPDDLLVRYAGMPLDFEPRTRWSYSNTGFVLLARVVEHVSGQPLRQLLAQRVFTPLNMTHTTLGPRAGAATGHNAFLLGRVERAQVESADWMLGAGNVYSSAADLVRWDLAFSTGTILSEASRQRMTTPHHTTDGRLEQYGCGLDVRTDRGGELVVSHTGAVEGFFAYNTFVPRTRSAVVLLTNDGHAPLGDLEQTIVGLVLERPMDVPVVAGPRAEDAARTLFHELQAGTVDRSKLGPELAEYWDPTRLAEAAPRLRALGEPTIALNRRSERGTLEVTSFAFDFGTGKAMTVVMMRARDGKIQQFLISP